MPQATIRIKGYSDIEQLALGKRTVVFAARSREGPVVVKALLPHLSGDRTFLTRFERAVRAAGAIRHQHLVNVLDFGRHETTYFVVMERYQGSPLAEILAEHPRVPAPIALGIVLRVACALEAVHAADLIHRDVRPANIVLTDSGGVKLANLGFATDVGKNGRVTHTGKVTATPAYMSPEQTRGEELDATSDIFSLGAVAYELLAGERAFGNGDFGDIVDRIQAGAGAGGPRPLGQANPVIEPVFAKILDRMLCSDPKDRYPHVSELVMDLEEAMEKYGYTSDDSSVAAYLIDPVGYADGYAQTVLERLTAKTPPRDGSSPTTLLRYYEKVSFLDPRDEGAKKELSRLRREHGASIRRSAASARQRPSESEDSAAVRFARLDPGAEYRVILESFDRTCDNEASFALKLSMKLRTPLPRVKTLVRRMPARVTDRQSYKHAIHLAKAIEDAGGRVRLDVCTAENRERPPSQSAPADARTCPSCGNPEPAQNEFCSVCMHRFDESRLDARTLRERAAVSDNPLAVEPVTPSSVERVVAGLKSVPLPWRIGVGALTFLFILQLFLR
jgi:serine/threonine-protein kinase